MDGERDTDCVLDCVCVCVLDKLCVLVRVCVTDGVDTGEFERVAVPAMDGVAVIDGERVCACVRERVPDRVCVCDVVSERVCEGVGDGVVTVPTCDGVRETLRDDD